MYRREKKIISVGETSHGIILPKPWINYHGLTEKDNVLMTWEGNTITIKPIKKTKTKKKEKKK